jgi:hypothetical protein
MAHQKAVAAGSEAVTLQKRLIPEKLRNRRAQRKQGQRSGEPIGDGLVPSVWITARRRRR